MGAAVRPNMRASAPLPVIAAWHRRCGANKDMWLQEVGRSSVDDTIVVSCELCYGLFGALSMVEHSCLPNARPEWRVLADTKVSAPGPAAPQQSPCMSLIAWRPIAGGDFV